MNIYRGIKKIYLLEQGSKGFYHVPLKLISLLINIVILFTSIVKKKSFLFLKNKILIFMKEIMRLL